MKVADIRILIVTTITGTFLNVRRRVVRTRGKAPPAKGKEMTMTDASRRGQMYRSTICLLIRRAARTGAVTGPANLEKHAANHTVTITGTAPPRSSMSPS